MASVFHTIADPTTIEPGGTGKAEQDAEVPVQARKEWTTEQVVAEYVEWSEKGITALAGLQEPPMAEMVVPLAWIERDGLQADEPSWWYGRGALAEPVVQPRPVLPPIVTPLPSDELPKPKSQMSLFDLADKAGSLPVPPELLAKLSGDEKSVLVLLRENGSARASELATRLNKNPGRLNGLMRALRRTLHEKGLTLFTDEVLPSGETMYRYQGKEQH